MKVSQSGLFGVLAEIIPINLTEAVANAVRNEYV